MDFDPTTNRIQFDLLTWYEQVALKAWPHGWTLSVSNGWSEVNPKWVGSAVYRGKPAPVMTSNWFNVYPSGPMPRAYSHRETADGCANCDRIAVLRIDTCNGVSTAHLEEVEK
jgi:hypothetical protein